MHIELFNARVLAPLVRFLESSGADSESILDRARIPGELVELGGWLTKKQVYDFAFDIVERTRCPHAIYLAYANLQLEDLGPVAKAMVTCQTVHEAFQVAAKLGRVAYEGSEYFLENDGDTTWFCYREPHVVSAGQTYINDMTLGVFYRLIRAAADDSWRPTRLRTRDEVIDRHRHLEDFAECRSSAHPHSSAMAFPTAFLSRSPAWDGQADQLDGVTPWRFGPHESDPFLERLYRVIMSQFVGRQSPTLVEVSRMIDVSPATLKRRLCEAGTSYSQLLDRARYDSARELLAETPLAISEIAQQLGYSGTNNFVRGFRRLSGVTPGAYRRQEQSPAA